MCFFVCASFLLVSCSCRRGGRDALVSLVVVLLLPVGSGSREEAARCSSRLGSSRLHSPDWFTSPVN